MPLGDSLQAHPLPTNSLAQNALPIIPLSSQPRAMSLNPASLFENITTIYGLEDERGCSAEGVSPYGPSLLFAAHSSTASATPLSSIPLPSISSNFTRLPTRFTVFLQRPLLLRSELSSHGRGSSRLVGRFHGISPHPPLAGLVHCTHCAAWITAYDTHYALSASGPIRNTRRSTAKENNPAEKTIETIVQKRVTKLTGIILHSPTSQATLMADWTVDMRRHVNVHFASPSSKKMYFCTGRPVDDFPQEIFEVLPENLQEIRAIGDVDFVGKP